ESTSGTGTSPTGPQRAHEGAADRIAGGPYRTGTPGDSASLETVAGAGAGDAHGCGRAATTHGASRKPIAHHGAAPTARADTPGHAASRRSRGPGPAFRGAGFREPCAAAVAGDERSAPEGELEPI